MSILVGIVFLHLLVLKSWSNQEDWFFMGRLLPVFPQQEQYTRYC